MAWNKVKNQLADFMNPKLEGIVEYSASGYQYRPDKKVNCYLLVNKQKILMMNNAESAIKWYESEQEAKKDTSVYIHISEEDIDQVRKSSGGKIPEDRLANIAENNKRNVYAKAVMNAQQALTKVDFQNQANTFMKSSIDDCLNGDDIILNILAIIDRRVGKKRLEKMKQIMMMKHPAVRYFYRLRLSGGKLPE